MAKSVKFFGKNFYMDFHVVQLLYFQKNDGIQSEQVAIVFQSPIFRGY